MQLPQSTRHHSMFACLYRVGRGEQHGAKYDKHHADSIEHGQRGLGREDGLPGR